MSVLDAVRGGLSPVIAAGGLTETWAYRRRTSAAGEDPVYGAWIDVPALGMPMGTEPRYDETSDQEMDREIAGFRVADTLLLTHDDQVRSPEGVVWVVRGLLSAGPGTRRYRVERDVPRLASPINRSQR